MKKVLIISPNFPPVNSADMHRVRQSLPYLAETGWQATVVAVEPRFVEMGLDENLLDTIPRDTPVIRLCALDAGVTRRFGLGNLGMRALWPLYRWGRQNLGRGSYDLVYFSTTAFPVMVLGRIWKKRYGIPFVIDMQDPWRNDYYLDKPRKERPPKFRMAYRMDKWMESFTMKEAGGIISVSDAYPEMLRERYPALESVPSATIPFGGAAVDFEVLDKLSLKNKVFRAGDGNLHIAYIGRGGHDMALSLKAIFRALKHGLETDPLLYSRVRMHFIGTSYARDGMGVRTIEPVALEEGVGHLVTEMTDRLPYFEALQLLKEADMLFVPGSMDNQYTASKLYPYILSNRPLMAIFHKDSSVVRILRETRSGEVVTFGSGTGDEELSRSAFAVLDAMLRRLPFVPETDWDAFAPYTAREMTRKQAGLFDEVISRKP